MKLWTKCTLVETNGISDRKDDLVIHRYKVRIEPEVKAKRGLKRIFELILKRLDANIANKYANLLISTERLPPQIFKTKYDEQH